MENQIKTKPEAVRLFAAGAFGNRLRQWGSLEELQQSGYRGSVAIRYKQPMQPFCRYHVPLEQVPAVLRSLVNLGANPSSLYFNEMGPDREQLHQTFQGEVQRSERYYDLHYSLLPVPMRDALKREPRNAEGIRALMLMRYFMCPSSFEDLQAILDVWPSSVVEFTTYGFKTVGTVAGRKTNFGRNTVFWEVRNY